jgi:hypothetical protein
LLVRLNSNGSALIRHFSEFKCTFAIEEPQAPQRPRAVNIEALLAQPKERFPIVNLPVNAPPQDIHPQVCGFISQLRVENAVMLKMQ